MTDTGMEPTRMPVALRPQNSRRASGEAGVVRLHTGVAGLDGGAASDGGLPLGGAAEGRWRRSCGPNVTVVPHEQGAREQRVPIALVVTSGSPIGAGVIVALVVLPPTDQNLWVRWRRSTRPWLTAPQTETAVTAGGAISQMRSHPTIASLQPPIRAASTRTAPSARANDAFSAIPTAPATCPVTSRTCSPSRRREESTRGRSSRQASAAPISRSPTSSTGIRRSRSVRATCARRSAARRSSSCDSVLFRVWAQQTCASKS